MLDILLDIYLELVTYYLLLITLILYCEIVFKSNDSCNILFVESRKTKDETNPNQFSIFNVQFSINIKFSIFNIKTLSKLLILSKILCPSKKN